MKKGEEIAPHSGGQAGPDAPCPGTKDSGWWSVQWTIDRVATRLPGYLHSKSGGPKTAELCQRLLAFFNDRHYLLSAWHSRTPPLPLDREGWQNRKVIKAIWGLQSGRRMWKQHTDQTRAHKSFLDYAFLNWGFTQQTFLVDLFLFMYAGKQHSCILVQTKVMQCQQQENTTILPY